MPGYLKEHSAELSASDKQRYEAQFVVVEKILGLYHDPAYSDQNTAMTTQIIELMNEVCSRGLPFNPVLRMLNSPFS